MNKIIGEDVCSNYVDLEDPENANFVLSKGFKQLPGGSMNNILYYEYDKSKMSLKEIDTVE